MARSRSRTPARSRSRASSTPPPYAPPASTDTAAGGEFTGKYLVLGICALAFQTAGIVVLTTFGADTNSWLASVVFFIVGGGYGSMLTVTLLACIAAVDHSQQAVITSATCKSHTPENLDIFPTDTHRPRPLLRRHDRRHRRFCRIPEPPL